MPKGSDTLVPIENVEVVNNKIKITKVFLWVLPLENIGKTIKR